MRRLEGKACLVTGTASGIGAAIADRFAREGGRLICVDRDAEQLSAPVDSIRIHGGEAQAVLADVSDRGQIGAAVDRCVEAYGMVDVLVNNAGVNLPGIFHQADDATIDRTLNVNLKGPIYGCQAAIPHMLQHGGGSIVNISSVNGVVAEPLLTIYAASKGGSSCSRVASRWTTQSKESVVM